MQVQRTASERRRARRKVNQRFLSAMMDMGIPTDKAELALSETGNVGVEVLSDIFMPSPTSAYTLCNIGNRGCFLLAGPALVRDLGVLHLALANLDCSYSW